MKYKINFGRIKKSCTFAIENEDIKVPALCFNMREAYREFGASRSLFILRSITNSRFLNTG
jgi:hypothetical protein